MPKKPILDLALELKSSQLSSEKANEHLGQIYSVIAWLYNEAKGKSEATAQVKSLDHNIAIAFGEFQAAQARVKVMGTAIQEHRLTEAELTEEVKKLQKILIEVQTGEPLTLHNGHHKNGRRA